MRRVQDWALLRWRGFDEGLCCLGPHRPQRQFHILVPILRQVWEATMSGECQVALQPPALTAFLQVMLVEPGKVPDKQTVLFQYDPAVLIVSIQWHRNQHSFRKYVRDRLYLTYANNKESVST